MGKNEECTVTVKTATDHRFRAISEAFKVTEHSFDENCKTSPIETNFAEDEVLLSDLPFMSKSL